MSGDNQSGDENAMRERLLQHLRGNGYAPQNKSELARALGIDSRDRKLLRSCIQALESEALIVRLKKGRYELCESSGNTLMGSIRRQRNGSIFFTPDGNHLSNRSTLKHLHLGAERSIHVPEKFAHTALHGDRVIAQILETGVPQWWRHVKRKRDLMKQMEAHGDRHLEARIVKILERRNARIVGTFRIEGKFAFVQPDDPLLPQTIDIDANQNTRVSAGDKVVVKIDQWHSRSAHPRGSIVRSFGPADAPGVDILSIIHKHQLPLEFPPEVLQEAEAIDEDISAEETALREDWRNHLIVTIDPFDARDFDDAIAVRSLPSGGWELAVHIADVSHYVRPGSALDHEAKDRGNSVYLVDRVIPMLPEKLSNGICSLKPEVDRLTRVAVMEFDENGNRQSARFASAVIRSFCRLTYEQAFERMNEKNVRNDDSVTLLLQEAWRLASVLRQKRFEEGALDLDFPEVRPILDDSGKPLRLARIEYDESHQLIEEFMLAANQAVAEKTRGAGTPSLYRVHEEPDPEKLIEFRVLVQSFGIETGDVSIPAELRKLMQQIKGHPGEYALKLGLLKCLKRAAYAPEPMGHYGLAKSDYTHFTSPIRRYADLIVHRVLWNLLNEDAPDSHMRVPKASGMKDIAEHISMTERLAADAEIETRKLKELEYLSNLVSSKTRVTFRAMVLDVRRMGLFVELTDYFVKGLVKPEAFPAGDDYIFERNLQRFRGESSGRVFQSGTTLKVVVAAVDLDRKFVDFQIVG